MAAFSFYYFFYFFIALTWVFCRETWMFPSLLLGMGFVLWSQILVGYCHMLDATTTLAYCADGTPLLFDDFVAGFILLYVSLWVACRVPSWTRKHNLESKGEGECSMSTPCSRRCVSEFSNGDFLSVCGEQAIVLEKT